MALQQTLQIFDLLDSSYINGKDIIELFDKYPEVIATSHQVIIRQNMTEFIRIMIPGSQGRLRDGHAPTLGIIGRLGCVGMYFRDAGVISDNDGAVAAITCALKLAEMRSKGNILHGDIIISTHISPQSFIDDEDVHNERKMSILDMETINEHEVDQTVDAFLSINTIKGSRLLNRKGIAISPTVKQGYILPVADDLLRLLEAATGQDPATFPITTQDITPYGNGIYHLSSIMQPSVATNVPVVGVAISNKAVVANSRNISSDEQDIASAVKFAVEVAKEFGKGNCDFYDVGEFSLLQSLYGNMSHLQLRR